MAHLPVFVEAAHGQIFRLETSEGRVQIRGRAKAANPSGGLQHLVIPGLSMSILHCGYHGAPYWLSRHYLLCY